MLKNKLGNHWRFIMKKYVRILREDLRKIHKRSMERQKYIRQLEKALASVNRQLENIRKAKNAETR